MLGFLVKTYPKISETFVLQEILAIQKEPYDVTIFSMQYPTDDQFHKAFDTVTAEINYLTPNHWKHRLSIKSHLKMISLSFRPYLSTLFFALKHREGRPFEQFCQAVYLTGLVQEQGIQHLHVHFASEPTGLAELTSRLCKVTYSISAHAKDIYLQSPSSLARKISNAQFLVTCTEYNRRYLNSINTSSTPVYRIYHGIDATRIMNESNSNNTHHHSDHVRIFSVGRLQEKKGFPTLIAACRLLKQAGYSFRCDIVGYGPYMGRLRALIDQYHLSDSVSLWGKMTHERVVEFYRQADIFALPCQVTNEGDRDGIPNVLMEAMTFAIPVVSTNISGIPEIIENNKTGLIIDAKNDQALFAALQQLIDNPELRYQMGKAGKHLVTTRFDAEQHIVQLKAFLTQSLQNNSLVRVREPLTGEQHG